MILSPHILASAALSRKIHNIFLLPFAAVISHFLLDRIPHWDYRVSQMSWLKRIFFVGTDHFLGFGTVFLIGFFSGWSPADYYLALISIFFGLLPDGFLVLYHSFPKNKYLIAYRHFHLNIHSKLRIDFKNGFPQEVAISVIAIILTALL